MVRGIVELRTCNISGPRYVREGTMKIFKVLSIATAAAVLVGGVLIYKAHAEDPAGPRAFGRGPVFQRVVKGLGLTDDQVSKIKTELKAEKDNLVPLLKNLHETRKALRETVNQPGVAEADVRAASAKVAAVEADLAVERAKLSGKIGPILTDEQIQKVKQFQAKMDDFFIGAIKNFGEQMETQE